MSIAILNEVYKETRRLAIAGSNLANGDFRLQKLVDPLNKAASPADLGAGWFEGLAQRNRYALLTRQSMWQQLEDYIASLDEEQFRRALVFLRRAFSAFNAGEKRTIAENLGEIWGVHENISSELLEKPLSEEEQQSIDDLNDFDFDDL